MKRILVIADLHCGHVVGLTPPRWQAKAGSGGWRERATDYQKAAWNWYVRKTSAHGPFDVVVCNGDAIDGRGERSGGTELIEPDRTEQCNMAMRCIQRAMNSKTKLIMTYGTAYHTGSHEDWEKEIASDLNGKIGSHEWIDAEGVIFDLKHHVGGSQVPYGRATAISREALWSLLWAERDLAPRTDVVIRSHVHYHEFCGGRSYRPRLRMTTPALQGMGSKYGARRCSGLIDFGFLVFEVSRRDISWGDVCEDLKQSKATVTKV